MQTISFQKEVWAAGMCLFETWLKSSVVEENVKLSVTLLSCPGHGTYLKSKLKQRQLDLLGFLEVVREGEMICVLL